MNHDFEARVSDVKSRAHGHWTPILRSLGVDERILKGKNLPCPSMLRRHRPLPVHRQVRRRQLPLPLMRCRWRPEAGSGGAGAGQFGELLDDSRRSWAAVRASDGARPGRPVAGADEAAVPAASGTRPGRSPAATRSTATCATAGCTCPPTRGRCAFIRRWATTRSRPGSSARRRSPSYPAMLAVRAGHRRPRRHPAPDLPARTVARRWATQSTKVLSSGINGAAVRLVRGHATNSRSPKASRPRWRCTCAPASRSGPRSTAATWRSSGSRTRCAASASTRTTTPTPSSTARPRPTRWRTAWSATPGSAGIRIGHGREVQVFVPRQDGTDWADIWLARLANDEASGIAFRAGWRADCHPLFSGPARRAQRQRVSHWQLPAPGRIRGKGSLESDGDPASPFIPASPLQPS